MLTRRSFAGLFALACLLATVACRGFFTSRDDSSSNPTTTTSAKFAYVSNSGSTGDPTISAYQINQTNGALTLVGSPVTTLTGDPQDVLVDAAGQRLFAVLGPLGILTFQIDRTNGAISSMENNPQAVDVVPSAAALSPNGKFLFVISRQYKEVAAFSVNSAGVLTENGLPLGLGSYEPLALTVDPSGKFLYVAADRDGTFVYMINSTNGALSQMQQLAPNGGLASRGVAISPDTKFAYISNGGTTGGVDIYSINADNGSLTLLSGSPVATNYQGPGPIAMDPTGKYLYVANVASAKLSAFTIGSDGKLTAISGSPYNIGNNATSVAVDPSSTVVYVTNQGSNSVTIFSIGTNGALSSVGSIATNAPTSIAVTK